MMRWQSIVGSLGVALAVWAGPGNAATITYFQDEREIYAYGWRRVGDPPLIGGSATAQPSPDFSYFSTGLSFPGPGGASQVSLLDGAGIAARGFALGAYDVLEYGGGFSRFSIVFEVDETTPWILDGTLYRSSVIGENDANARVVLSSGGTVIYSAELPPNSTPGSGYYDPMTVPVLATGEIGPGQYELFIEAESNVVALTGGFASYDFVFVVPEPHTALLLLPGLIALGVRAGRRGQAGGWASTRAG